MGDFPISFEQHWNQEAVTRCKRRIAIHVHQCQCKPSGIKIRTQDGNHVITEVTTGAPKQTQGTHGCSHGIRAAHPYLSICRAR